MREGAGQRQSLLLAAGQLRAQRVQPILDFVPQHGLTQARFDQLVQFVAVVHAGPARRVGHVLVDRQRQTDRQGKDHADAPAQLVDVADLPHVLAIDQDLASRRALRSTKSIVRLMHFSSVVLPELAGPMIPRIVRGGTCSEMSCSATCRP